MYVFDAESSTCISLLATSVSCIVQNDFASTRFLDISASQEKAERLMNTEGNTHIHREYGSC